MAELNKLMPMLPELVLIGGALLLLLYGVLRPETEIEAETVGWLSVALLAACAYLVWTTSGSKTLFGGGFIADPFARIMKLLTFLGAAGALVLSFDDMKDQKALKFEYPILVLLATAGMLMMISASDLLSLYLGLELQSLALYVVAAFRRDDVRSSEAGLKYFVLGALSSGMLLYGASLIYGFAGTTSFAGIAAAAKAVSANQGQSLLLVFGLVFLLVGLAFKISAVPFHMWTPDVYEGAPTPVTAFFAAAPKVAAMALLVRVASSAFPDIRVQWQPIILFLSIGSMLLGALAAIGQTNIKRLMAYSSIANMGYALLGLAAGGTEGIKGVIVYIAIYVVMTLGTFACILSMRRDAPVGTGQLKAQGNNAPVGTGGEGVRPKGLPPGSSAPNTVEDINELAGLAQTNLYMAFALAMFMFSMAGIPPLAGFFAKLFVFQAAISSGLYIPAIIGVVASVIGAYYYLRIVKIMFFDEAKPAFAAVRPKAAVVMGLSLLFVLAFVLPFVAAPIVEAAAVAAKSLH
ncbi:MAG: NADH-quinone oxidoreductase subunit NuoN [Hyphomicrobiaceae bacterium]